MPSESRLTSPPRPAHAGGSPPYPNADKAAELIEAESDPAVRSMMRLVYGEFLVADLDKRRPEGGVDLLYCFETLQKAFRRKDAVANALKGEYGGPGDAPDWT